MVTSMVDEATQRAAACGAFAGATVSQCAVPKLNMEFSSRAVLVTRVGCVLALLHIMHRGQDGSGNGGASGTTPMGKHKVLLFGSVQSLVSSVCPHVSVIMQATHL
jgi:hypothetical protein